MACPRLDCLPPAIAGHLFERNLLMRRSFAAVLVIFFSFVISLSPRSWAVPVEPAEKPAREEQLAPPPPEEVLRRIEAPAVSPVIKTKGGYTVTLDLARQVLNVSSPKKEIWLAREVEPQQTVEVTRDGTALQQDSRILAKLK